MSVLEALLLASPEPLSIKRIAEIMELDEKDAHILLDDLRKEYQQVGRGIYIRELAGGYTLTTLPEHAKFIEKLLQPKGKGLSHAALETLAIIAYRQPITRAEIESVRGVQAGSSLDTLMERRLVRELGRKETAGRPMVYGTTRDFLQYFGLNELADLPPMAIDTTEAGLILKTHAGAAESEPSESTDENADSKAS